MTKTIEISHKSWASLYHKLRADYPPSYVLIRRKMKEKLGFVPREHRDWNKDCIMLDFYDSKKQTAFLLKYSEYLK